ncbi:DedA family protein [bacterium]|nr:DedA family protein [bacterium]
MTLNILLSWVNSSPVGIESSAYLIVFVLLTLCGLGLPLPEEVTFILGGYLVDRIDGSLELMIVLAVSGVLLGDTLLFFLAQKYGENLLKTWPFKLIFSDHRLEKGRNYFKKHGSKTVFFAGFFAGIRAATFFLSASMKTKYSTFLFWDGLRTLLTCPISIWFGFRFGPYAHEVLKPYKFYFFCGLGVIFFFVLFRKFITFGISRNKEKEVG